MRQTLEQYDRGINRRGQKGESSNKITYHTAISRLERFGGVGIMLLNAIGNQELYDT